MNAQLEKIIVEKYYISDANDATDFFGGGLEENSTTYRIYVDLVENSKLLRLIGTTGKPFIISSTEPFFNNTDRGGKFGYNIGTNWLKDNTTAVDTWITMGFATNNKSGIIKELDTDGSIVGGVNNDGGSSRIEGGLLVNDNIDAGIPLTEADGLLPNTKNISTFNDFGIDETSIFISDTTRQLIKNAVLLNSNEGVQGETAENLVLIAQLTTKGDLTFSINIELQATTGNKLRYFATTGNLQKDEFYSPWLTYPPASGCKDPYYLEYDSAVVIDDGSCQTPIVLGCMNAIACNYDPDANFHIEEICCYDRNNCGGRVIGDVCPNYINVEEYTSRFSVQAYPNPVTDMLILQFGFSDSGNRITYSIFDTFGSLVKKKEGAALFNNSELTINTGHLRNGLYLVKINLDDGKTVTCQFLKHSY